MWWKKSEPEHECWYDTLTSVQETINSREYTHCLQKCSCGEWRVETIEGKWTPEQIAMIQG